MDGRGERVKLGRENGRRNRRYITSEDGENYEDESRSTIYINLYNSVHPCRHIAINSYASAPLNASKIAVMKVRRARVVMFRPELLF